MSRIGPVANAMFTGAGGPSGSDPGILDPLIVDRRDDDKDDSLELVPWLGGDIRVNWPVNAVPRATLSVGLADGWGVNIGSVGQPDIRSIDETITDGQIYAIHTGRGDGNDFWLFEGFIEKPQRGAHPHERRMKLNLVHIADELRTAAEFYIGGQWQLSIFDFLKRKDDIGADAGPPVEMSALPCVYNPNGKGNRLWNPLTASDPDVQDSTWTVNLFQDHRVAGGSVKAAWNWAQVIMDLLTRARGLARDEDAPLTLGDFTRFKFGRSVLTWAQSPVDNPEYVDLVDWLMEKGYDKLNPDNNSGDSSDPFERVFGGKPHSHAIEGMNWQHALDWTCMRAGLCYFWEAFFPEGDDGSGGSGAGGDGGENGPTRPTWRLHFFIPGSYTGRVLRTPSRKFRTDLNPDGTPKKWSDVRSAADVTNLDIESDYAGIINDAAISGAAMRREVTIEFAPGWKANADWDVDPTDQTKVDKAIAAIGTEAWNKKYLRTDQNPFTEFDANTGRYWIVNTVDEYPGTEIKDGNEVNVYARSWAPWKKDRYALFALDNVGLTEWMNKKGEVKTAASRSAVRPRIIGECLSGRTPGRPLPPIIEYSCDSGATWRSAEMAEAELAKVDMRLYFKAADMNAEALAHKGLTPAVAYIKGKFRVRVTGGIELDQAFYLRRADEAGRSLSQRVRHGRWNRSEQYELAFRDDRAPDGGKSFTQGGNSAHKNGALNTVEVKRDDTQQAKGEIGRTLKVADRVRHSGPAELPELVFPYRVDDVDYGWKPGDEVDHFLAEPGAHAYDTMKLLANKRETGAIVAGVVWTYRLPASGANGDQAFGAGTQLMLEDGSRWVRFDAGERS